jgi:hypothetical protein
MVNHPRPPACAVRWPTDYIERKCWLDALADPIVRDGWRRAYTGAPPTAPEQAVRLLGGVLDELPAGEPLLAA